MALREFWTSVRTAAGLLLPTAAADSTGVDPIQIEVQLQNAAVWLTPESVEGYAPEDFGFLSEEERARLAECVDDFLAVAGQVPADQPATQNQVDAAQRPLREILNIFRPEKYADLDALVLGKQIEHDLAGRLPDWVLNLQFETGEDASGDPAIWIWVEMKDSAAEKDVFSSHIREVRRIITESVRHLGIEHWPYVRFRTASEVANAGTEG